MSKNNSRRASRSSRWGKKMRRFGELGESAFLHKATTLGLRVARPFGVEHYDFIVASKSRLARVQVKMTTYRLRDLWAVCCSRTASPKAHTTSPRSCHYRPSQVDFFAMYIQPEDTWYIIPASVVCPHFVIYLYSRHRYEHLHEKRTGPPGGKFERYREAWHLLQG
jgi:hypothetical protein